jgi:hypothetical protein
MSSDHKHDGFTEERLSEALDLLARHSRRSAPPEVGAALLDAFQRRRTAGRRLQTLRMTAIAAILCLAAGLIFMTTTSRPKPVAIASSSASAKPAAQTTAATPPVVKADFTTLSTPPHRTQYRQPKPEPASQRAERSSDFMILPGWSSAAPREQLRIVRMELPALALRMVGAPVSEEVTERPVLADFVVGQDGTPYAMRLVQQ